jgi:hypothetical protein
MTFRLLPKYKHKDISQLYKKDYLMQSRSVDSQNWNDDVAAIYKTWHKLILVVMSMLVENL